MHSDESNSKCIYCGRSLRGIATKEHVVPVAISGKKFIRGVCSYCNEGPLSLLDRELCSRSLLSLVAHEVLGSRFLHSWDVDHTENNVLVEANRDPATGVMTVYPQITFEETGPQMRFDFEQLKDATDNPQKVFITCMLQAFHDFKLRKARRLFFERIEDHKNLFSKYRLPPRVFTRRSIREFNAKMTFVLRYRKSSDRRRVLHALDTWPTEKRFPKTELVLGSHNPPTRCEFRADKVILAFAKIGINLLVAFCERTNIDRNHFPVISSILSGYLPPESVQNHGFVNSDGLAEIAAPLSGHGFRLLHDRGDWTVFLSFFGGKICGRVSFTGPNRESWCCADVVAPLNSPDWEFKPSLLLLPIWSRVSWTPATVSPSINLEPV